MPLGFDPAVDLDPASRLRREYANIDLPPEAFRTGPSLQFARRRGFNTDKYAKRFLLNINQFRVADMESHTVNQFDVSLVPIFRVFNLTY